MTSELITFNHLRCNSSSTALGTKTGCWKQTQRGTDETRLILFGPRCSWKWLATTVIYLDFLKQLGTTAMHIFFPFPNVKTTVLYSQASGLCLIVRNTGSRWLDIFTCKNPRPTHHIYWPVLSLFFYCVQTRILWKRTNLQNDKSKQIEWKWKYLLTEFI